MIAAATEHGSHASPSRTRSAGALSYRAPAARRAILGRKLMPARRLGEAVGVMLPNANGAAVAIFALMSAGRVPAMINFTSGLDERARRAARPPTSDAS